MAEYSQYSHRSHLVAYVGYEPSVIVFYVEHHAIANRAGILARSPDGREIIPWWVHPFDDSDPRTERALPNQVLLLCGFNYMLADYLHAQILANC